MTRHRTTRYNYTAMGRLLDLLHPSRETRTCGYVRCDKRLSRLQMELFDAVMAHEFSSVNARTWPRVSTAAHALQEFYS